MPTKIGRVRETRAVVFTHTCETCGKVACFGVEVKLKEAIRILRPDNVENAVKMMGKWFCRECLGNEGCILQ